MHNTLREHIAEVKSKYPKYFKNQEVIEIGSLNINGSARSYFTDCKYTGVDLFEGPGVDVVDAGHKYLRGKSPTVVVCTEVLEHDRYWFRTLVSSIKSLKSGGFLLLSCATSGRPIHGTSEHRPEDSPATNNYYRNILKSDIEECIDSWNLRDMIDWYAITINEEACDLYLELVKK